MKYIKLYKGQLAIVDDEDFKLANNYKWYMNKRGYVKGMIGDTTKSLHRIIMGEPSGNVDHINGNKLDNRQSNLRICNQSQNCANSKIPKNNTSGYKGVHWNKALKKWQSYIMVRRKRIHLGYFYIREQAGKAYNDAAVEYFGEFARLNNIKK